jgi:hypothetical protein
MMARMRLRSPALTTAVRLVRQSPGVVAAAVISLALGIGANTALFSITVGLLLRPLPYTDPDRLVILWNRSPGLGIISLRCDEV